MEMHVASGVAGRKKEALFVRFLHAMMTAGFVLLMIGYVFYCWRNECQARAAKKRTGSREG